MKVTEVRDLTIDELQQRARDMDDQLFRLRIQKSELNDAFKMVVIAILLFAALIRPFGLVAATYAAFIVSVMGSTEMRWVESIIGAAVMTAFCVGLFVYLLGLPFQLWPAFLL